MKSIRNNFSLGHETCLNKHWVLFFIKKQNKIESNQICEVNKCTFISKNAKNQIPSRNLLMIFLAFFQGLDMKTLGYSNGHVSTYFILLQRYSVLLAGISIFLFWSSFLEKEKKMVTKESEHNYAFVSSTKSKCLANYFMSLIT